MSAAALLKHGSALPPSLAPRGLSRVQAAEYVGISATKFDEMVSDKRMPRPKRIDGRRVWDKVALDEAFAALPNEGETAAGSSLDRILGLANENSSP